jgi:uncharacterized protein (TIGR03067 family)
MKNALGLCLALFAATLLLADDKKKDAEKPAANKDLAKLAGKWQPTSMQIGKAKLPDAQLKAITMTLEGNKYKVVVVEDKGPSPDKGTLKIDPKAKPMTMDINGEEGPNKGKTMLCIYEVDAETLKICYDLEGKKRPTEFKADTDKTMLAVYKRAK